MRPQVPQSPRIRWSVRIAGLLLVFVLARRFIPTGVETIPYSEFLNRLDRGQVTKAEISSDTIEGSFTDGDGKTDFRTVRPPGVDDQELSGRAEGSTRAASDELDQLARLLLEREELDGEALRAAFAEPVPAPH